MKYHFSVFSYDTEQKILSHGETPLEMTKKNHELLQFLLTNPNRLIDRDELIEHVWHGRVVTNNTIDQCILKLRKTLNNIKEDDYIESVYGQGIRFLPQTTIDQKISDEKLKFKPGWITLMVMMILLPVWLLFNQYSRMNSSEQINPVDINVISQAEIKSDNNSNHWILNGATSYLLYLINQYPNIKPQNPRKSQSGDHTLNEITIDLIGVQNSNFFLQVGMSFIGTEQQDTFLAELTLRDQQGIIAKETLSKNLLSELFPTIARWVGRQLNDESPILPEDTHIYSRDEFALQSYFRAMHAQKKGNSQQALTFLQAAVEQDADFKMAWYEMAIAMRKQGDPRKAIGILHAIKSNNLPLAYRVSLVKAQCYDVLGEFQAAEQTYQNALSLAMSTEDPAKVSAVRVSQAILYRKTNQFELAEAALEEASAITDVNTQPMLYGTIMNTHAKLAREMNKPLVAIEKAQQAIKSFQIAGDLRYQMQAKTVLASILRLRNEFSQAEKLVKESLFHAEQLNNRRGISDNRTKLARLYHQTGRFRLAHQQWQLVLSLNNELELYGNLADAYLWLLKLHLDEGNNAQADIDLKMLQQIYEEHPDKAIKELLTEAKLIVALQLKDIEQAQQYLQEMTAKGHPLLAMYQGDQAMNQEKNEAAELHYLEALVELNNSGRFDYISTVLNRLNVLYLKFKNEKLADNLLRTQRLKPFIYPLQKYQAMAADAEGNHIKALSLMEELKLKAGDYWQYQDQLILESMQSSANTD